MTYTADSTFLAKTYKIKSCARILYYARFQLIHNKCMKIKRCATKPCWAVLGRSSLLMFGIKAHRWEDQNAKCLFIF